MPICLECGSHAETVEVLWNAVSKRDERFCLACARSYKREHPDHRPRQTSQPGATTTLITSNGSKVYNCDFGHPKPINCELCGKQTYNKVPTSEGVILCFACQGEVDKIQRGGARFTAGTNGVVSINTKKDADPLAVVEKKYCWECKEMKPKASGRPLPDSRYSADWWCYDCIAAKEEGDVCNWHVKLKIKGKQEDVDFFHWMMRRLDADWVGGGEFAAAADEICPNCEGWEWNNPRMNPHQVKRLGKMAGLRKIKVEFWGKAQACDEKVRKQVCVMPGAAELAMLEGMVE